MRQSWMRTGDRKQFKQLLLLIQPTKDNNNDIHQMPIIKTIKCTINRE